MCGVCGARFVFIDVPSTPHNLMHVGQLPSLCLVWSRVLASIGQVLQHSVCGGFIVPPAVKVPQPHTPPLLWGFLGGSMFMGLTPHTPHAPYETKRDPKSAKARS